MRRLAGMTLAVALIAGCGASASLSPWAQALPRAEAGSTDALLAQARAGFHGGTLSKAHEAALLASVAPEHARARAILEAMRAPAAPAAPTETAEPTASLDAPRLQLATPPPDAGVPSRSAKRSSKPVSKPSATGSTAASTASKSRTATPPVPTKVARTTLNALGLKKTNRGAALSLKGSGGLVVGIANQPQSGIVRLVMDAEASTAALRARPTVTGAKVTGVRRTGKTVFVTLALDPGWSLRGIVRTASGARVDLRRPA